MAPNLAQAMATISEVTRQHWASMTPEQRAEYGLPAIGWGRVLFDESEGARKLSRLLTM